MSHTPPTAERLHAFLASRQEDMIRDLRELIDLETPSTDKDALDAGMRIFAGKAAAVAPGALVDLLPQADHGDCVRLQWGQGGPKVLLLGHLDTVWPHGTLERRPVTRDGDTLYGPGSYDMKAGLVQGIWAVRALQEFGAGPAAGGYQVVLLCNSDEEIGSPASRGLIEREARDAAWVFVLEPSMGPDGALKTARKGVGIFEVEVQGRSAHAGIEPEAGVSAIHELSLVIQDIYALAAPEKGTTLNVGVVQGGSRRNVVAARASAEVDLRVATQEEADRVVSSLLALKPHLPGAIVTVTGKLNRPPMERSAAVAAMAERAIALAERIGVSLAERATGGGSDGNFTAAMGVPTLDGLGALGAGAHAEDERIVVPALAQRAALLACLLELAPGADGATG